MPSRQDRAGRRWLPPLAVVVLLAGAATAVATGVFDREPAASPDAAMAGGSGTGEEDGAGGTGAGTGPGGGHGASVGDPPGRPSEDAGSREAPEGGGRAPRGDEEPAAWQEQGAATSAEVERILAEAERAYASLSSLRARFHQTIEVPLLERRREGHGIWYQRGRSHFKMDFLDPPDDEIVADGVHLWLYYPSTNPKQVIRSRLGEGSGEAGTADVLARILAEARTAYRGEYAGREEVDGVAAHVVSLRPVGRSPYLRVRVWIGASDLLVRRFEITEENETVRTVTLFRLEPNVSLPPSLFRFEPPPDADVFEG